MTFAVADFEDLVRLLAEPPDWREWLRSALLGDRWEGVPGRLDRIEQILAENGRQLAALTERMDALTGRIEALCSSARGTSNASIVSTAGMATATVSCSN